MRAATSVPRSRIGALPVIKRALCGASKEPVTSSNREALKRAWEYTNARQNWRTRGSGKTGKWQWVKNRYPKWNPGKWKHGLKSAVPWWFNFDPCPHVFVDKDPQLLGARTCLHGHRPGSGDSQKLSAADVAALRRKAARMRGGPCTCAIGDSFIGVIPC